MKALRLLTGLVPSTGSGSAFNSAFNISGRGGGTLLEMDFFRRRKKAEDFFIMTGWFSLFAEVSVEVRRTALCTLLGGVEGACASSCTGVDRPWCDLVKVLGG